MKTFDVKVLFWHESYNGFDHRDGIKVYQIQARNVESARKKAYKLAKKDIHVGWVTISSIMERE